MRDDKQDSRQVPEHHQNYQEFPSQPEGTASNWMEPQGGQDENRRPEGNGANFRVVTAKNKLPSRSKAVQIMLQMRNRRMGKQAWHTSSKIALKCPICRWVSFQFKRFEEHLWAVHQQKLTESMIKDIEHDSRGKDKSRQMDSSIVRYPPTNAPSTSTRPTSPNSSGIQDENQMDILMPSTLSNAPSTATRPTSPYPSGFQDEDLQDIQMPSTSTNEMEIVSQNQDFLPSDASASTSHQQEVITISSDDSDIEEIPIAHTCHRFAKKKNLNVQPPPPAQPDLGQNEHVQPPPPTQPDLGQNEDVQPSPPAQPDLRQNEDNTNDASATSTSTKGHSNAFGKTGHSNAFAETGHSNAFAVGDTSMMSSRLFPPGFERHEIHESLQSVIGPESKPLVVAENIENTESPVSAERPSHSGENNDNTEYPRSVSSSSSERPRTMSGSSPGNRLRKTAVKSTSKRSKVHSPLIHDRDLSNEPGRDETTDTDADTDAGNETENRRLIEEAQRRRCSVPLLNLHLIYCKYCIQQFTSRHDWKRHRFYQCSVSTKRGYVPENRDSTQPSKKPKISDSSQESSSENTEESMILKRTAETDSDRESEESATKIAKLDQDQHKKQQPDQSNTNNAVLSETSKLSTHQLPKQSSKDGRNKDNQVPKLSKDDRGKKNQVPKQSSKEGRNKGGQDKSLKEKSSKASSAVLKASQTPKEGVKHKHASGSASKEASSKDKTSSKPGSSTSAPLKKKSSQQKSNDGQKSSQTQQTSTDFGNFLSAFDTATVKNAPKRKKNEPEKKKSVPQKNNSAPGSSKTSLDKPPAKSQPDVAKRKHSDSSDEKAESRPRAKLPLKASKVSSNKDVNDDKSKKVKSSSKKLLPAKSRKTSNQPLTSGAGKSSSPKPNSKIGGVSKQKQLSGDCPSASSSAPAMVISSTEFMHGKDSLVDNFAKLSDEEQTSISIDQDNSVNHTISKQNTSDGDSDNVLVDSALDINEESTEKDGDKLCNEDNKTDNEVKPKETQSSEEHKPQNDAGSECVSATEPKVSKSKVYNYLGSLLAEMNLPRDQIMMDSHTASEMDTESASESESEQEGIGSCLTSIIEDAENQESSSGTTSVTSSPAPSVELSNRKDLRKSQLPTKSQNSSKSGSHTSQNGSQDTVLERPQTLTEDEASKSNNRSFVSQEVSSNVDSSWQKVASYIDSSGLTRIRIRNQRGSSDGEDRSSDVEPPSGANDRNLSKSNASDIQNQPPVEVDSASGTANLTPVNAIATNASTSEPTAKSDTEHAVNTQATLAFDDSSKNRLSIILKRVSKACNLPSPDMQPADEGQRLHFGPGPSDIPDHDEMKDTGTNNRQSQEHDRAEKKVGDVDIDSDSDVDNNDTLGSQNSEVSTSVDVGSSFTSDDLTKMASDIEKAASGVSDGQDVVGGHASGLEGTEQPSTPVEATAGLDAPEADLETHTQGARRFLASTLGPFLNKIMESSSTDQSVKHHEQRQDFDGEDSTTQDRFKEMRQRYLAQKTQQTKQNSSVKQTKQPEKKHRQAKESAKPMKTQQPEKEQQQANQNNTEQNRPKQSGKNLEQVISCEECHVEFATIKDFYLNQHLCRYNGKNPMIISRQQYSRLIAVRDQQKRLSAPPNITGSRHQPPHNDPQAPRHHSSAGESREENYDRGQAKDSRLDQSQRHHERRHSNAANRYGQHEHYTASSNHNRQQSSGDLRQRKRRPSTNSIDERQRRPSGERRSSIESQRRNEERRSSLDSSTEMSRNRHSERHRRPSDESSKRQEKSMQQFQGQQSSHLLITNTNLAKAFPPPPNDSETNTDASSGSLLSPVRTIELEEPINLVSLPSPAPASVTQDPVGLVSIPSPAPPHHHGRSEARQKVYAVTPPKQMKKSSALNSEQQKESEACTSSEESNRKQGEDERSRVSETKNLENEHVSTTNKTAKGVQDGPEASSDSNADPLEMSGDDESDLSRGLSANDCHLPSWVSSSISEIVASPRPPLTPEKSVSNVSNKSNDIQDTMVRAHCGKKIAEVTPQQVTAPVSSSNLACATSATTTSAESSSNAGNTDPDDPLSLVKEMLSGTSGDASAQMGVISKQFMLLHKKMQELQNENKKLHEEVNKVATRQNSIEEPSNNPQDPGEASSSVTIPSTSLPAVLPSNPVASKTTSAATSSNLAVSTVITTSALSSIPAVSSVSTTSALSSIPAVSSVSTTSALSSIPAVSSVSTTSAPSSNSALLPSSIQPNICVSSSLRYSTHQVPQVSLPQVVSALPRQHVTPLIPLPLPSRRIFPPYPVPPTVSQTAPSLGPHQVPPMSQRDPALYRDTLDRVRQSRLQQMQQKEAQIEAIAAQLSELGRQQERQNQVQQARRQCSQEVQAHHGQNNPSHSQNGLNQVQNGPQFMQIVDPRTNEIPDKLRQRLNIVQRFHGQAQQMMQQQNVGQQRPEPQGRLSYSQIEENHCMRQQQGRHQTSQDQRQQQVGVVQQVHFQQQQTTNVGSNTQLYNPQSTNQNLTQRWQQISGRVQQDYHQIPQLPHGSHQRQHCNQQVPGILPNLLNNQPRFSHINQMAQQQVPLNRHLHGMHSIALGRITAHANIQTGNPSVGQIQQNLQAPQSVPLNPSISASSVLHRSNERGTTRTDVRQDRQSSVQTSQGESSSAAVRSGHTTSVYTGQNVRSGHTPLHTGQNVGSGHTPPMYTQLDARSSHTPPVHMGQDARLGHTPPVHTGQDARSGHTPPVHTGQDETTKAIMMGFEVCQSFFQNYSKISLDETEASQLQNYKRRQETLRMKFSDADSEFERNIMFVMVTVLVKDIRIFTLNLKLKNITVHLQTPNPDAIKLQEKVKEIHTTLDTDKEIQKNGLKICGYCYYKRTQLEGAFTRLAALVRRSPQERGTLVFNIQNFPIILHLLESRPCSQGGSNPEQHPQLVHLLNQSSRLAPATEARSLYIAVGSAGPVPPTQPATSTGNETGQQVLPTESQPETSIRIKQEHVKQEPVDMLSEQQTEPQDTICPSETQHDNEPSVSQQDILDERQHNNESGLSQQDISDKRQHDNESGLSQKDISDERQHNNESGLGQQDISDKRQHDNESGLGQKDISDERQHDNESGLSQQDISDERQHDNESGLSQQDISDERQHDNESGLSQQDISDERQHDNESGLSQQDISDERQHDNESGLSQQDISDKRQHDNESGLIQQDISDERQHDNESGLSQQDISDERQHDNESGLSQQDISDERQHDNESGLSQQDISDERQHDNESGLSQQDISDERQHNNESGLSQQDISDKRQQDNESGLGQQDISDGSRQDTQIKVENDRTESQSNETICLNTTVLGDELNRIIRNELEGNDTSNHETQQDSEQSESAIGTNTNLPISRNVLETVTGNVPNTNPINSLRNTIDQIIDMQINAEPAGTSAAQSVNEHRNEPNEAKSSQDDIPESNASGPCIQSTEEHLNKEAESGADISCKDKLAASKSDISETTAQPRSVQSSEGMESREPLLLKRPTDTSSKVCPLFADNGQPEMAMASVTKESSEEISSEPSTEMEVPYNDPNGTVDHVSNSVLETAPIEANQPPVSSTEPPGNQSTVSSALVTENDQPSDDSEIVTSGINRSTISSTVTEGQQSNGSDIALDEVSDTATPDVNQSTVSTLELEQMSNGASMSALPKRDQSAESAIKPLVTEVEQPCNGSDVLMETASPDRNQPTVSTTGPQVIEVEQGNAGFDVLMETSPDRNQPTVSTTGPQVIEVEQGNAGSDVLMETSPGINQPTVSTTGPQVIDVEQGNDGSDVEEETAVNQSTQVTSTSMSEQLSNVSDVETTTSKVNQSSNLTKPSKWQEYKQRQKKDANKHKHCKIEGTSAATNASDMSEALKPKKSKIVTKTVAAAAASNEQLNCICKTPYNEDQFYIGCDRCQNWFHGTCVNITEEEGEEMDEYRCQECTAKKQRNEEELYCICRTPYDESLFYIGCDKCLDWYHGRCVGISESKADSMENYICAKCQNKSTEGHAEQTPLSNNLKAVNEHLKKIGKQLQNQVHKDNPETTNLNHDSEKYQMTCSTTEQQKTQDESSKATTEERNETKLSDINCALKQMASRTQLIERHMKSQKSRKSFEEPLEIIITDSVTSPPRSSALSESQKSFEEPLEIIITDSVTSPPRSSALSESQKSFEEPLEIIITDSVTSPPRSSALSESQKSFEEPLEIIITDSVTSPPRSSASSDLILSEVSIDPNLPDMSAFLSPPITTSSLSPAEVRPYLSLLIPPVNSGALSPVEVKPYDSPVKSKRLPGIMHQSTVHKDSQADVLVQNAGETQKQNVVEVNEKSNDSLRADSLTPQMGVKNLCDDGDESPDIEIVSVIPAPKQTHSRLPCKPEKSPEPPKSGTELLIQNSAPGRTLRTENDQSATSERTTRNQEGQSLSAKKIFDSLSPYAIFLNDTINRRPAEMSQVSTRPLMSPPSGHSVAPEPLISPSSVPVAVSGPLISPSSVPVAVPGPLIPPVSSQSGFSIKWRPNNWGAEQSSSTPSSKDNSQEILIHQTQVLDADSVDSSPPVPRLPRLQPAPSLTPKKTSLPLSQPKQLPALRPSPAYQGAVSDSQQYPTPQVSVPYSQEHFTSSVSVPYPHQDPTLSGSVTYSQQNPIPSISVPFVQQQHHTSAGSVPYSQENPTPSRGYQPTMNTNVSQASAWVADSISATSTSANTVFTNRQIAALDARPVAEVSPQSRTNDAPNSGDKQNEVLPIILSVHSLNPHAWNK